MKASLPQSAEVVLSNPYANETMEAHFTVEPVEEVVALPATKVALKQHHPVLSPINRSELTSKHSSIVSSKPQLTKEISRDDS